MKLLTTMRAMALATVAIAGVASASAETHIQWSTTGNRTDADGKPCYTQRFTITGDFGFRYVAFNQFARQMKPLCSDDSIIEIVPGYYKISSPRFASASRGDTVVVDVETRGSLRSICYAPDGVHLVKADGTQADADFSRADITASPEMWRSPSGDDNMPYGDAVYDRNAQLAPTAPAAPYEIIPSLKSLKLLGGESRNIEVTFEYKQMSRPTEWTARIADNKAVVTCDRAYEAIVRTRLAAIGLFTPGAVLPDAEIHDYPDFGYRGVMIDIARNYQSPAELKRVLTLMNRYGLNVLHLHFADDEAWRIEIPGMPELTEVGGRRGYTTDEHEFLAQIFTGNGNPDNLNTSSNGFLTRNDFIDLIRTADSLGIIILPEVESPGHARAAIKAMERRFRTTGDDTYRLIDPDDRSVYTSAQSFHDDVMNPALPGPVKFMTHVAAELQKMYREAGVEMPALHIGGDEVAKGAWTASPIADEYMKAHGITNERDLHLVFVSELLHNLTELGIPVSGWQEIAVGHDEAYNKAVRPHVFSVNCWSTLGRQSSVTAQSAAAGYPTVLSNVNHFYLDMCYSPHPYERGLSWGGYVDEFDALHGYPHQLCQVDSAAWRNVVGVSGQLFAETIRSGEMLESFLLPKMLGLAERAWNAGKTYSDARFNDIVDATEIPWWQAEGFNFHVRQPGVKVVDGKVAMNTAYAPSVGAVVRYTIDGSNPTAESPVYGAPIEVPASKQVRAVTFIGDKSSVASILYID